jgi:hypothetical protein
MLASEPMPPRSIRLSLTLMLATVAAGLLIRLAPLGLPYAVVKYGGSMLWALMIYWIVSTLTASVRLPIAALIAGVLATAVEFLKLYRAPTLDAFRLTLPGIILLGRFFSITDIAAYWFAILCGAFIDARLRPREVTR